MQTAVRDLQQQSSVHTSSMPHPWRAAVPMGAKSVSDQSREVGLWQPILSG
jgi:hypothetical protein